MQFFMLLLLARVTFFFSLLSHSSEHVILGHLGCEITILRKDAFYKT